MGILQWFVDLGASVMLPMIIYLFALVLGTKPSKAFRSGLTVGIGFIGLNLVIGLLTDSLGPAAQAMVDNFGFQLHTIDIGWPASAAISYGTRSEEHTSELQSRGHLVCRLLLEKKKNTIA